MIHQVASKISRRALAPVVVLSERGPGGTVGSCLSTTKNTKPHENEKWVSPNAIRAERSEQEVAAAAFVSEPVSLSFHGTAGQAGPWHTVTFFVFVFIHIVSPHSGGTVGLPNSDYKPLPSHKSKTPLAAGADHMRPPD